MKFQKLKFEEKDEFWSPFFRNDNNMHDLGKPIKSEKRNQILDLKFSRYRNSLSQSSLTSCHRYYYSFINEEERLYRICKNIRDERNLKTLNLDLG